MITLENLNYFSFHYSITMSETDYCYKIEKDDYGFQFEYDSITNIHSINTNLSLDTVKSIIEILNRYSIEAWAGFHKEDPNCCDGDGFMVKMTISDCNMMAIGSNCYPEGYHQFKKELDEIVKKIIKGE